MGPAKLRGLEPITITRQAGSDAITSGIFDDPMALDSPFPRATCSVVLFDYNAVTFANLESRDVEMTDAEAIDTVEVQGNERGSEGKP